MLSSAGLPALPAGTVAVGDIYSFLPHGTSFAVPVEVTVPFDPSLVPAGETAALLKTSAGNAAWEVVPLATTTGGFLTGEVTSFSGFVGAVPGEPVIATQPQDRIAVVGDAVTFTVQAEDNGYPPLAYQWRRNGVDIQGATASGYALTNVTPGDDNAFFSVVVSNPVGFVLSDTALLTVITPPAGAWTTIGGKVNTGSDEPSARDPAVAVGQNGEIFVAYVTGTVPQSVPTPPGPPTAWLRVKKWDTNNPGQWVQVGGDLNVGLGSDLGLAPERPTIKIGSDGHPRVAWLSREKQRLDAGGNPIFEFTPHEIVVQQWNGTAWQRIGGAPNNEVCLGLGFSANFPLLTLGAGTDRPYLAFLERTRIAFRQWDDGSMSWVPSALDPFDRQRACSVLGQSGIGLAVTSGGTVYIAGSGFPGTEESPVVQQWISVWFRGPEDNGYFGSQLGGGPVNTDALNAVSNTVSGSDLTLDANGNLILAYAGQVRDGDRNVVRLAVRRWNGSAWVPLGSDYEFDFENDRFRGGATGGTFNLKMETVFGFPGVAWIRETGALQSGGRWELVGRVWDGTQWHDVSSPHAASVHASHFALAVGPADHRPYVALIERTDLFDENDPGVLYVRTCDQQCAGL